MHTEKIPYIKKTADRKRYVYLDKFDEYKKKIDTRFNLLGKTIFWGMVTNLIGILLCLVGFYYHQH